jgi:hypothetical protein
MIRLLVVSGNYKEAARLYGFLELQDGVYAEADARALEYLPAIKKNLDEKSLESSLLRGRKSSIEHVLDFITRFSL